VLFICNIYLLVHYVLSTRGRYYVIWRTYGF